MNRPALLILGSGALILVGLFALLRPAPPTMPAAPSAASAPAPPAASASAPLTVQAAPPALSFDIVVSQGRKVSGPALIQVHAGEDVVLHVTSDQADELHLHGYDLHLHLHPGEPGTLSFKAVHTGRFDYELHHAQLELGALEVLPQ
jgi:hypothetical protein